MPGKVWLTAAATAVGLLSTTSAVRLRSGRQESETKEFCSFNVFGSDDSRAPEVANSENVLFQSGGVLIVEDAGLRVMVFREGSGKEGAQARCQEEAEVQCEVTTSASPSTMLIQELEGDIPQGACATRKCTNPDAAPRLSIMRSMVGGAVTALEGRNANRIAMIGLGGGSIPLWFEKSMPTATVEAVDINPDVIAAVPCMGVFPSDKMKLIDMDGRAHLNNQADGSYDVIFVDAYTDKNLVPNCLRTVEFFKTTSAKMAPGGVLLMNVWRAEVGQVFTAMAKAFPAGVQLGTAPGLGNLILMAHAEAGSASSSAGKLSPDAYSAAQTWAHDTSFSGRLPSNSSYDDLIGATMSFLQTGEKVVHEGGVPDWIWKKLPVSDAPDQGITDAEICK